MGIRIIPSIFMPLLAAAGLSGATGAAAHPAGACNPVLEAPKDGAQVATDFTLRVGVSFPRSRCDVDRIDVHIVDVASGNTVYSSTSDCCDVITSHQPVIDRSIPKGELATNRDYRLTVRFYDKHLNGPASSAPAIAFVTTEPPRSAGGKQGTQGNGLDAMAFAVDKKGHFGHGRAPTEAQARKYAIRNCGQADCSLAVPPVRARCVALADSTRNGYWLGVGAAKSEGGAITRAIGFCEQGNGGKCRIEYSYCQ